MQLNDAQRKLGITPFPVGGATGDVLVKASPANFDVAWSALLGGAILAGNGIVFAGNTVHFAQAAAYTAGAMPFAAGAATIGFDATNLFWDNTNKRLGIGLGAPLYRLHATEAVSVAGSTSYLAFFQQTVSAAFVGTCRAVIGSVESTQAANSNTGLYSGASYSAIHQGAGNFTGVHHHIGLEVYHGKGPSGTGSMAATVGLFVQALNQNVAGAVTVTYDVLLKTAITTGAITTRWGVYQEDPDGFNFFAGHSSIGTASTATTHMLRLERNFATTSSVQGLYSLTQNTPAADTGNILRGAYVIARVAGASNYTLATDSVIGIQGQALHNGTGTVAGMTGVFSSVIKQTTGLVTNAYGFRVQLMNSDATGAIGTGYGFFGQTPTVTGAITTYYGLFLQAGAGTTVYGIAQSGAADLNYLAGFSAFGSTSPVNTTFALFGASTATIASMRIAKGSAAYGGAVEGDYWNDFTQGCLIGHINGLKQYDARVSFVQTADKAITNTNAETTMFGTGIGTLTFPANFFSAGKTLKITLRGKHTMDATPPTITFRVKLGGVTFASVAYTDLNDTDQYFELDFLLTCRTTGAGGTGIGQGYILMSEVSGGPPNIDFEQLVMTATAAMNTTGALALDVTAQPSVADAGSALTITNAIVEVKA